MTRWLNVETWDVFTDTAYTGNPLAIVRDADGLSAEAMQMIAREFNLSETIFVMAPRDPAHRARVRIFFPTAEIPFAGHPTIGCAIHLALRDGLPDGGTRIVLEEEAGLVPVRVWQDGARVMAELTAPVTPFATGHQVPPELTARALSLAPEEVASGASAHQGGPRFLFARLRDLDALARARPAEPDWSAAMERAGVDALYAFVELGGGEVRSRMFSPTAGIPEDPATGSAAALLVSALSEGTAFADGETRLQITQGVEMGRPSTLRVTAVFAGGGLDHVRVAGGAVPLSEGRLRAP